MTNHIILGILVQGIVGQEEMGLCIHVLIPIKCILAEDVKVKAGKLCKLSVIYVQNGDWGCWSFVE